MLITLYGPDSYNRIQKLSEIVESYRDKYTGFSYERFDLSENNSFVGFRDFIKNTSMFDPVKLVVLDNLFDGEPKKEIKDIIKNYKDRKDTTIVINLSKKPPATHKFLLEKPAQSQEFPHLKNNGFKDFVIETANNHGLKLSTEDVNVLIEMFDGDTWGVATEIERISFASDYRSEPQPKTDYFILINTLKHGRSARERLTALEIILSGQGFEPARVFNSIAYRLGSQKEAEKFANYDVAVKSGKLEYEEILLSLALSA